MLLKFKSWAVDKHLLPRLKKDKNRISWALKRAALFLLEKAGRGSTDYFGEFGYELIGVLPYAYWLHSQGKLKKTKSTKDTKCLYYFSPRHAEVNIKRSFIPTAYFPVSNIFSPDLNTSKWAPPEYKKIYKNTRFIWDKPTCVICNKFNIEWEKPPVNFISLEALEQIFSLLKNSFQIIYNRPLGQDIVGDHSPELVFNDFKLIREKFPEVVTMQNIAKANPDLSFNTLQLMVLANSNHFISVQGGSAGLASYFGGQNIIYAVEGLELKTKTYQRWYHKLSACRITHVDNYHDLILKIKENFLLDKTPLETTQQALINLPLKKIKLFSFYTDNQKILKDNFLRTLKDDWDLNLINLNDRAGQFGTLEFSGIIKKKIEFLTGWIKLNWGSVIIWSDIDIQFFKKCSGLIDGCLKDKDIVFLAEHWPHKEINSGFMVLRCNDKTLRFFELLLNKELNPQTYYDQGLINNALINNTLGLAWDILPCQFWAQSHSTDPDKGIVLHHANCTTARMRNGKMLSSLELKTEQLNRISIYVALNKFFPFFPKLKSGLKKSIPGKLLPVLENIWSKFLALFNAFTISNG